MKKFLLVLPFIAFLIISCESEVKEAGSLEEITTEKNNSDLIRNPLSAKNDGDTVNVAKIEFEVPVYDFGTIDEGDMVQYSYVFKNTGKKPLVIKSAKASCGCTIPKPSKEPIAPGETGEIPVTFNSSGKGPQVSKTITVTSNAYPNITRIKLVGTVNVKEN